MPNPSLQDHIDRFAPKARQAWQWWTGELIDLVPPKARCVFAAANGQVTVEFSADGVRLLRTVGGKLSELGQFIWHADGALQAQPGDVDWRAAIHPDDRIVLDLDEDKVLRKTMRMPMAPRRDLARVLKFELERQSPIAHDHVDFDFQILATDRATRQLDIELQIVERDTISRCLAACHALGLEPSSIAIRGQPFGGTRLLQGRSASSLTDRLRRHSVPALAALVLLLGVSAIAVTYVRNLNQASSLAAQITAARVQADASDRLRHEISDANKALRAHAARKQAPMAIKIVSEVTRILPNDSWITGMEISGPSVRIRGLSANAPALIPLFDQSSAFTDAQFSAPITQGPTSDLERFDMSFRLQGDRT